MKRAVDVASWLAIAFCLAGLAWLYFPSRGDTGRMAVSDIRTVHFQVDAETTEFLTEVELEDQLRDWLLYAVLNESGLNAEALRKTMYDVPPTRAQYVKPIAAFDFGPARFRVIDAARTTVALIPENAPNRKDLLAQVADSVRTSFGDKPSAIQLFEYRIDLVEMTGQFTRKPNISSVDLFGESYGYIEKHVGKAEDLQQFLSAIDDLVWVTSSSGGLELGGRVLTDKQTNKRRLRLEDIAALWQSEAELSQDRKRAEQFEAKWKDRSYLNSLLEPIYQEQLDRIKTASFPELQPLQELYRKSRDIELNRKLRSFRPRAAEKTLNPDSQSALAELKKRWEDPQYLRSLIQPIYDREFEAFKKTLSSKGSKGIPDGSGFSLDPAFDYEKLRDYVRILRPVLEPIVPREKIDQVEESIRRHDEGPFLALMYSLQQQSKRGAQLANFVEQGLRKTKFQHARYDGKLSGTEVGMVLFYTDLLAKLWALDYLESAPDKPDPAMQVRGFVPLLKVGVSPIFEKELEALSGTRLWFGPRESGFSKTGTGLLFAPIATRVYAASSNMLQPGKEAEPNAASAAFLGWWNDHYRHVADFEPEYHRLNQIMKWSVVLGWLSSEEKLGLAKYLDSVPVKRDNWFPEWAERNQRLRFRQWGTHGVEFFRQGYKDVETESMPILLSRPYWTGMFEHSLSGGVSLASKDKISKRPKVSESIEPLARRANVIEAEGSTRGQALRSLDDTSYRFPEFSPEQGIAAVEVKAAGKLRGLDIELKPDEFKTHFKRSGIGLRVEIATGGNPIGALSIERNVRNQIDIIYSRLAVEYSRSYSKTLSNAASSRERLLALAARPDVQTVIEANGVYYVEPYNSASQWLRITNTEPEVNIAAKTDVRFASLGGSKDGGSQWNVVFLNSNKVELELPKNGAYLLEVTPQSPTGGTAFSVRNRGPPPPPGSKFIVLDSVPPPRRDIQKIVGGGGKGRDPGGSGGYGRAVGGDDGGAEAFARQAALDPKGILLMIAERRRARLEHSDRLLENGRFDEARVELDELAALDPSDPDVLVRRVVAHAAEGSKISAAVAARTRLTPAQVPELLDRAGAVLPYLTDGASQRRLDAIVRGCLAKAEGKEVRFLEVHGEIGIELRLAAIEREARKPAIDSEIGVRYTLANVDNNPELGWAPMPPPSEPITGKFRDASIGRLKPEAILDPRSGARYWRAEAAPATLAQMKRGGGNPFWRYYGSTSNTCSSLDEEERKIREDCRPLNDVYELSLEPNAAATPSGRS